MGESGRHQSLEPALLTLPLQNHPESICSHGTSRKIVQTEGTQEWHRGPRSAMGSHAPGSFCLSFPFGMKKRSPISCSCHAGLSPGSTCVFRSSLDPFVPGSSGCSNCICGKGRSSRAAMSKTDVGLSEYSPRDPAR